MGYVKMANYYFPHGRFASPSHGYPLSSLQVSHAVFVIILFQRQDVMILLMFFVYYFITQRMSPKISQSCYSEMHNSPRYLRQALLISIYREAEDKDSVVSSTQCTRALYLVHTGRHSTHSSLVSQLIYNYRGWASGERT